MKKILIIIFLCSLPIYASELLKAKECNNRLYPLVDTYEKLQTNYLSNEKSNFNIRNNFSKYNERANNYFAFSKTYLEQHQKTKEEEIPQKLLDLDSYNNEYKLKLDKFAEEGDSFLDILNTASREIISLKKDLSDTKNLCDENGKQYIDNIILDLDKWSELITQFNELFVKTHTISLNLFAYVKDYLKLTLVNYFDKNALKKAQSLKSAIQEILNDKSYERINNIYYGYYHDPNHYNKTRTKKCLLQRSIELLRTASYEYSMLKHEIDPKKTPALYQQYLNLYNSLVRLEKTSFKNWKTVLTCQTREISKVSTCPELVAQYNQLPKNNIEEFLIADRLYTKIYDQCMGGN